MSDLVITREKIGHSAYKLTVSGRDGALYVGKWDYPKGKEPWWHRPGMTWHLVSEPTTVMPERFRIASFVRLNQAEDFVIELARWADAADADAPAEQPGRARGYWRRRTTGQPQWVSTTTGPLTMAEVVGQIVTGHADLAWSQVGDHPALSPPEAAVRRTCDYLACTDLTVRDLEDADQELTKQIVLICDAFATVALVEHLRAKGELA